MKNCIGVLNCQNRYMLMNNVTFSKRNVFLRQISALCLCPPLAGSWSGVCLSSAAPSWTLCVSTITCGALLHEGCCLSVWTPERSLWCPTLLFAFYISRKVQPILQQLHHRGFIQTTVHDCDLNMKISINKQTHTQTNNSSNNKNDLICAHLLSLCFFI